MDWKGCSRMTKTINFDESTLFTNFVVYLFAFIIAIGTGAIIIFAIMKINPFSAISLIFSFGLFNAFGLKATFQYMIPLTLISLGLALCYKAKYFNIGADGQLIFGTIFSMQVIFSLEKTTHSPLAIPLILLSGMVGGAFYSLIPATLKAKFNISEILTTLMLNFVAIYFMTWLVDINGPWKDPTAAELESYPIPSYYYLENPAILLSIVIIAIIIVYLIDTRTILGFQIKVVGSSQKAAEYSGINRTKVYILLSIISGALAGLAGSINLLTTSHILSSDYDSVYLGYLSIFTTWLAALNPLFVIMSSLLMGVMISGGYFMASISGVSQLFVYVFEGLMFISLITFKELSGTLRRLLKYG